MERCLNPQHGLHIDRQAADYYERQENLREQKLGPLGVARYEFSKEMDRQRRRDRDIPFWIQQLTDASMRKLMAEEAGDTEAAKVAEKERNEALHFGLKQK